MVDAIHRDKNIPKEKLFTAIEAALVLAAKKSFGEDQDIVVSVDRQTGQITGTHGGQPFDPEEFCLRIGAQAAKQVIMQKIREEERDVLYEEYLQQKNQLVTGVVQRMEKTTAVVSLGNTEAILPRVEQIPGETYHPNERIRAIVCDVRKEGTRVRVILSRVRPQLVERLFEQEIPEVADGIIEIRRVEREAGFRTKVAVFSTDPRVDSVGACVGVRGTRIKNITDELGGERIEIVRWSDDVQEFIANALQPAEVEEVILCPHLGRAIALVKEEQRSLAIGRGGHNVRLASKLCGWDIDIMTREELDQKIEAAMSDFVSIPGITPEIADELVGRGFLTYDDLSVIEPEELAALGRLSEEEVEKIVAEAERRAEEEGKVGALASDDSGSSASSPGSNWQEMSMGASGLEFRGDKSDQ